MAATMATLVVCLVAVTALGLGDAGMFSSIAAAQPGPQSGPASDYPAGFAAPIGRLEHASALSTGGSRVVQVDHNSRSAAPAAGEDGSEVAETARASTPEELSTGPMLEWTEIDPGLADVFHLQSMDDGRVLARAWDIGDELSMHGERALYTDNGVDWTELALPEGILIRGIDASGDRWLVYGYTHGDYELRELADRMFFTDDQGANWTEVNLDIPADATASANCDRYLLVESVTLSDGGIVVDLWGDQVSDEPSHRCPDFVSMRLLWSDGSTVKLADLPEESIGGLLAHDADAIDNGFAVSAADGVLRVQRVENGEPASTTATFEGLLPTWTLAAGPAGVALTAVPSLDGHLEVSTLGGVPVWRDSDRVSGSTEVPLWLGWSADGTDWGWQSLPDTFGVTEGGAWADLAVGGDFVIAQVETILTPTAEEIASWQDDPSAYEEFRAMEAPPVRWFIARVS